MSFMFIMAIVAMIVMVFAATVAVVSFNSRPGAVTVLVLAAIAAGLLSLGSAANMVPIRSVGIVTEFGKPTGEVTGSGLHWVAPWKKLGEWDASRQKYDHRGKHGVKVRTATMADAWVETLIEWQVVASAAPSQFMEYKGSFSAFQARRVDVQLDNAVIDAFASYDPLANIENKGNVNIPLEPYARKIEEAARVRLAADVKILSVIVTRVNHDDKTEANIKAYQDKIAQGRNLDQDKVNADKQAEVTRKNASVDQVTRCLEIAAANGTNPGWCLNPGISTTGK